GLLNITLCHSPPLGNQVGENAEIRKQHKSDHPQRLTPTGDVVTPDQITKDDNEEPEPDDKCKDRNHVHQKVRIGIPAVKEHHDLPVPWISGETFDSIRTAVELDQGPMLQATLYRELQLMR